MVATKPLKDVYARIDIEDYNRIPELLTYLDVPSINQLLRIQIRNLLQEMDKEIATNSINEQEAIPKCSNDYSVIPAKI